MGSTRATPLVSKDRPRGLTPISPPFHLSVHLFTPQILGGRRIALSDVKRILQDAIGASRELESRSAKLREAAVTFEEEAQTELKAPQHSRFRPMHQQSSLDAGNKEEVFSYNR